MDVAITLPILLAWAVHLSDYSAPEHEPRVRFEPHSFFVEQVCGGQECPAVGWYNDRGIIYIDERHRDDESEFTTSLMVHELVHYLQDISGKYDSNSCVDSVAREREAYYIQNEYILRAHGSFAFIRPGPTSCNYGSAGFAKTGSSREHNPGRGGSR